MHLGDPVAQRVHDQLQRVRMLHVEAVAGPCCVVVVLRPLADQPVVGAIVDAFEAQRLPEVVALSGVVVNDVEDDLDSGFMHRAHHVLELVDLLAPAAARRVLVVRSEETDRVVAPVVAQTLFDQPLVVDELVHRHELHRGHAERGEVLNDGRVRETGIRAAKLLGHLGMTFGHSLHVRLVDDRFVQRDIRPAVTSPVEMGMLEVRAKHVGRAVRFVEGILVARVVRVACCVPGDLAFDRARVGIEQQLAWVAANPAVGSVRTVHAIAVALPGADVG